jgi:hypothetical protein
LQVTDLLRVWGTPVDQHHLDKEWPNFDKDMDGFIDWVHMKRLFEVCEDKHIIH